MSEHVLTARAYIHADYDTVWSHLTDAGLHAAWSSAPGLRFGDAAGDAVAWGTDAGAIYRGVLEWIEKGAGLRHTFAFLGFGIDEPPTPVEIDVRAAGPVVFVAIRHDCTEAPRTAEMISPGGWLKSLMRLKTLLETGTAMPWPE